MSLAESPVSAAADPWAIDRRVHDVVVPQLFFLRSGLALLRRTIDPAGAEDLIDDLDSAAFQALSDLSEISRGMSSEVGGRLDDVAERLRITTRAAARLSGCRLEITHRGDAEIPAGLVTDLLSVTWESLSNAVRHGGADRVGIVMTVDGDRLRVVATDNGAWRPGDDEASSGLIGLRRRAEHRGGHLTITGDHAGTRLEWVARLAFGATSGSGA